MPLYYHISTILPFPFLPLHVYQSIYILILAYLDAFPFIRPPISILFSLPLSPRRQGEYTHHSHRDPPCKSPSVYLLDKEERRREEFIYVSVQQKELFVLRDGMFTLEQRYS